MKKATWLFSSVIAALLATGAPAVVSAETVGPGNATDNLETTTGGPLILQTDSDFATADSTAEVIVNPGKLSLNKVPNLNFGSADVKDLIAGEKEFPLLNGNLGSSSTNYDGNANQVIEVQDYRGSNVGWTLTANLDQFRGTKGDTIEASKLVLDGTPASTADGIPGTLKNGVNVASQAGIVLSAGDGSGSGVTSVTLNSGTVLTLPEQNKIVADAYQAKIVWTLAATPAP